MDFIPVAGRAEETAGTGAGGQKSRERFVGLAPYHVITL